MKLDRKKVQHLLLRAGFGESLEIIDFYTGKSPEEILKAEFKKSMANPPVRLASIPENLTASREMSQEDRMELQRVYRQQVKELNTVWIKSMASDSGSIHQKMTFFWHDHFACRTLNSTFAQQYLSTIQSNALGNFRDLLHGVSKSPAMLQYLNNQQNRKNAPNENFAREVMELFTLGRDQGYSEADIKEAARAFTGWTFDETGTFRFAKRFHDSGEKNVLGQTGNFDGDDVLDILLKNRQTADYLAYKWVRFFVNPKGSPKLEKRVADNLWNNNYDIKKGLIEMFSSKEFYEKDNIGARIKNPLELLIGFQRQVHTRVTDDDALIFLQRTMGLTLFDPPNVAGWPDGKDWVDSATLILRLNLPKYLLLAAKLENDGPASFDDNDQFRAVRKLEKITVEIDRKQLEKSLGKLDSKELTSFFIQLDKKDLKIEESMNLQEKITLITSQPEYQLC